MENEIKIGEYCRTKDGYIAKCIEVDEDGDYYTFDNYVEVQYGDEFYSLYDNELKNIVKHSSNLIDIIEEGDYVNGHLVIDIPRDGSGAVYLEQITKGALIPTLKEDIQTIVTKEMMESISYKVETH